MNPIDHAIALLELNAEAQQKIAALAWLDGDAVRCSDAKLLEQWTAEGIAGRAAQGRLFPRDGRAFLEELPFMYKSPYLCAAPLTLPELCADYARLLAEQSGSRAGVKHE
jgi:hypothetical protein